MQNTTDDVMNVGKSEVVTNLETVDDTMVTRSNIATSNEEAGEIFIVNDNEVVMERDHIKHEQTTNDEEIRPNILYSPACEMEMDQQWKRIDVTDLEKLIKQAEILTSFVAEHDDDVDRSVKFKDIILNAVAPYKELYELMQLEKLRKIYKMVLDQAESLISFALQYDNDVCRSRGFKQAIIDAVVPYRVLYEKLQAKSQHTPILNFFSPVSPIPSAELSDCLVVSDDAQERMICNSSILQSVPAAMLCQVVQRDSSPQSGRRKDVQNAVRPSSSITSHSPVLI